MPDVFDQAAAAKPDIFDQAAQPSTVNVGTVDKPFSSYAGVPVDLKTGAGAMQAAQFQAQQATGQQAEQMKGIPMGLAGLLPGFGAHAPASIAADKAAADAWTQPAPIPRSFGQLFGGLPPSNVPKGSEGLAQAASKIPQIAQALSAYEGVPSLAEGIGNIPQFLRTVLRDPVTGKVTITPTSMLERALRSKQEVNAIAMEQKAQALMERGAAQAKLDAEHAQKLSDIEAARQKELAANERLKDLHARALQSRKEAPQQPFAGTTYQPPTGAPAGGATPAQTPAQEFAQRQAAQAAPTPSVSGFGSRPNDAERYITQLMSKAVLTPEEFSNTEKILGPEARIQPGEGIATWRARILGLVRAGRAGKGMKQPMSFISRTE
jgi:hypothetical protein